MKIFRDTGVTINWSSNTKTPINFWSNPFEKHQNFKCSLFRKYRSDLKNSNFVELRSLRSFPLTKLCEFLWRSDEKSHFAGSPDMEWPITFMWSSRNRKFWKVWSRIFYLWLCNLGCMGGTWKLRCHFWCYNNNIRSDVFRSFFDVWCLRCEFDVENNFHGVSNSFLIF